MDPLLKPPTAPAGLPPDARPHRVVWDRAAELAVEVFRMAAGDSRIEAALRDPLRAAALAIPTCLARALGRGGGSGSRGQLLVALGALSELESHLSLAAKLRGGAWEDVAALRGRIELVRRLIVTLGARESRAERARRTAARLDSLRSIR